MLGEAPVVQRAALTGPGQSRASASRRWAELKGRAGEIIAAGLLIAKGYRIIARRMRGPFGEIDIIAARGRRLAFVEVKLRRDRSGAKAANSGEQVRRIEAAAERWLSRNRRYLDYRIGLDAIVIGRLLIPRHLPNALHSW
jgi:putative endonuclease